MMPKCQYRFKDKEVGAFGRCGNQAQHLAFNMGRKLAACNAHHEWFINKLQVVTRMKW